MTNLAQTALLTAVGSLALLAACRPPASDPRVSTPEGCWEAKLGTWGRDSAAAAMMEADSLYWVLRLDTAAAVWSPEDPNAQAAATFIDGRWRDYPFQRWRHAPSDTLVIDHPAAFSGVTLRVGNAGGDLEGIAVGHSDVFRPGQGAGSGSQRRFASVRLKKVECPEQG